MNNAHSRKIAGEDTLMTFRALLNLAKVNPVYEREEEDILSVMDKIDILTNQYEKVMK